MLRQARELSQANKVVQIVSTYHCYLHLCHNPLLPSLFRTLFSTAKTNERILQIMNEPLALGFLAQDACHHLIERTDGITEEMLRRSIQYGPGEIPPGWRSAPA